MCAATWRAAGPLPYRRAHAGPAIVGQRGWRRRTVQVCRSRRPRAALAQRRAQSLRKIVMLRLQADAEHRAARPLVHVVLGPLHTQRCRTVMSRSTGELMRVQRAGARVVCEWAEASAPARGDDHMSSDVVQSVLHLSSACAGKAHTPQLRAAGQTTGVGPGITDVLGVRQRVQEARAPCWSSASALLRPLAV